MDVTYQFDGKTLTNDIKQFKDVFFKKKFDDFMNMKTMISIAPAMGDYQTIFQISLDFSKGETSEPNTEANRVILNLKNAFKPLTFNVEIRPNGCNIISNFTYSRIHTLDKIKTQYSGFLGRVKNLDTEGSFSNTPVKRIGYDKETSFFHAPSNENDSKQAFRNQLFSKTNPYSEEYWHHYISTRLIPDHPILTYSRFTLLLFNFENSMATL